MNSDNHHSCCCGETREPPRPHNTCSMPYYDPRIVPDCICGTKPCTIFGTHDYYPPGITCAPPKKKREKCNTLGSPIGLVISTGTVRASDSVQLRYAICLKAFAKIFISPEREWSSAVIDQLLKEGQQLIIESNKADATTDAFSPPEIYSDVEARVKRSFQLAGCSFIVELSAKFRGNKNDIAPIGDELLPDIAQGYFKSMIKQFFGVSKYCYVKIGSLCLMIWKSRGVYFVFDCNGRRPSDFTTDREKGFGMLICLKSLSNVCHLVKNLSDLSKEDTFSLREMKVVKLVGVDGKIQNRDFGKRTNQYEIVSSDFAVLKAQLHLTLNKADIMRSRSALPVTVATLLASKIDHPATWNQKTLDHIICYGYNVCKKGWCQVRSPGDPVQVNLFPTQLTIGQFIAGYLIIGPIYKGTWKCVPNFADTDLSKSLKESIEGVGKNFIIQLDNQFYAVWKKNNFIYFMDVYRHRLQIPVGDNEDQKSATLRMFRTIDTFLKIFNIVILESARTTPFFIYKVQIKKLNLVQRCEGVPEDEVPLEEDEEVKSLNEAICFEEDDTICTAELGEISDYEDEELTFDEKRIDLESESEESEEGMEEEEMGLEDLGEFETSSSGDEGHGHGHARRGRRRGKGKTKSERDKQLHKSSKGKKGGKKGKGSKDDDAIKKKGKKGQKDKKGKKSKESDDAKTVKGKKGKKEKKLKDSDENKKLKDKKGKKDKAAKDKNNKEEKKSKDIKTKESKGKKGKKEPKEKQDKEPKEKKGKDKKDKNAKKGKGDKEDSKKETRKDKEKKDKKKKNDGDESDDEDPSKKKAKKDKMKKEKDSDEEKEDKKTAKKRKKDKADESDSEPETSKSKAKKPKGAKDEVADDKKNKEKLIPEKNIKKEKFDKDDKPTTDDSKNIKKTKDTPEKADKTGGKKLSTDIKKESFALRGDASGKDSKIKEEFSEFGEGKVGIEGRDDYKSRRYEDGEDEDVDDANRDILGCKANNYPGYSTVPRDMAVVGSESGSYESICKLLRAGFKCADRILTMTPWGNYVVFRGYASNGSDKIYFLFDGCTCNVNRFRHLDLNCGTAGLLCFKNLHDVICYILDSHKIRTNMKKRRKNIVDEICRQYCK